MADMPEPVPGPGEVLVDVAFAGCNWADTQVRTGIYPHARTYPLVLGLEISGTVSKLGPGVGVQIGDRVAAFLEQGGAYARTGGGICQHADGRCPRPSPSMSARRSRCSR